MENEFEPGADGEMEDGYVSPTNPTVEDFRALEKQNRRLFARVQKGKVKKTEAPAPTTETPANPAPAPKPSEDTAWKERIELKTDGYSDKEIDFIQKNGGRAGLEDPFVKAAVETIRGQSKAEQAQVAGEAPKSEIEKQYTDAQLKDMPTAELEKILPKA